MSEPTQGHSAGPYRPLKGYLSTMTTETKPLDNDSARPAVVPAIFYFGAPDFLADWHSEHPSLSDERRTDVGRYIAAIVDRRVTAGALTDAESGAVATDMWKGFRRHYDGLRVGDYSKSEREAFVRAMSRI